MPKEIITLQFGNYSNYVGTHWWNIQESSFVYNEEEALSSDIDHNVLFREGQNSRGDITFTPRLVFTDFSDNLGCLSEEGTLYKTKNYGEAQCSWDNKVDVHHRLKKNRNQFLQDLHDEDELYENGHMNANGYLPTKINGDLSVNKQGDSADINLKSHVKQHAKIYYLDKQVRTWSDFKKVHYHPRSTLLLNQRLCSSSSFESWISGVNLAKSGNVLGQLEDTVRFYAEECDNMQGFHLLCDMENGFGGLTCSALEYLHDEYTGKSFAVFPTFHAQPMSAVYKAKDNMLSTLLTLSNLLPYSSFLCPLSLNEDAFQLKHSRNFSHLIYDASSRYHTSAILAACLDGATSAHRLKHNSSTLAQLSQCLTSGIHKFVGLCGALPLPFDVGTHANLPDLLDDYKAKDLWTSLTPNMGQDKSVKSEEFPEHCFSQAVALVGLDKSRIMASSKRANCQNSIFYDCSEPNSMINLYLEQRYRTSNNLTSVIHHPLKVSAPFPHIFSSSVLENGLIKQPLSNQCQNLYSTKTDLGYLGEHSSIGSTNVHEKHLNGELDSTKTAVHVDSVPVLTNLKTSSALVPLFKRCYSQSSLLKRWVSQHRHSDSYTEQEGLVEVDELFHTLEQDYSINTTHYDSDDSD